MCNIFFLCQISLPSSNSSLITVSIPEIFAWPLHCLSTPQVHMSAILLIPMMVGNKKIPFDVSSGIMSLPSIVKTVVLGQRRIRHIYAEQLVIS
jgi:hypothetical protein